MSRDDTFRLLLKTLLRELFPNKGEILSCRFVKPCKNRKNSKEYYARTRDKSGSNSPFPGTMHSQMPGVCPGGGCLSFNLTATLVTDFLAFFLVYYIQLINSDNRNNMIIRGSDRHSHNTRSKDTFRIIKSDTNWGLLRSLNSALLDWNALPMEMRNLSCNAFRI